MKVFTRYIPLLVLATLAVTGCQIEGNAKYTGGGSLPSAGGKGTAVLTFAGDTCDGNENAKGKINFRDDTAIDFENVGGVTLKASIAKAGICPDYRTNGQNPPDGVISDLTKYDCLCPGWPAITGTYTSTNTKAPGTGKFRACLYNTRDDADAGSSGPKTVYVNDLSLAGGPYAGYVNHGVMKGNFQTHACDKVAAN